MKSLITLFILLPIFGFSQPSDSVKKEAIRLQIRAFDAEQKHQFDSAILFADSSIALNNTRYEPYIIKAESLWFLKRFSEAAETYKKKMEVKRPDFLIGAYVLLGMLYDKAGNRKVAKEQYSLAIKTWENGYTPPRFDKWEEIEYFIAFGLLRDKNRWKKKLSELQKKYPAMNKPKYEVMSRKELLDHHFSPYGG
jgi:tetratricopeptide (TPR) repeat protein